MKFKAALTAAMSGRTIVSDETGNYYIPNMGYLKQVVGTAGPTISECLGTWSVYGATTTSAITPEIIANALKIQKDGGSLTKLYAQYDIEYPQLRGVLNGIARKAKKDAEAVPVVD